MMEKHDIFCWNDPITLNLEVENSASYLPLYSSRLKQAHWRLFNQVHTKDDDDDEED
jgi:hypothetical protein